jgi:hypothetical protein
VRMSWTPSCDPRFYCWGRLISKTPFIRPLPVAALACGVTQFSPPFLGGKKNEQKNAAGLITLLDPKTTYL